MYFLRDDVYFCHLSHVFDHRHAESGQLLRNDSERFGRLLQFSLHEPFDRFTNFRQGIV